MLAKEIDIIIFSIISGRRFTENFRETYSHYRLALDSSNLNIKYHNTDDRLYKDLKSRETLPSLIIYELRNFPAMDTEWWLFHKVVNKKFPGIKKIASLGKIKKPENYLHSSLSDEKIIFKEQIAYKKPFGKEYLEEILNPKNHIIKTKKKELIPSKKNLFDKVDELLDLGFRGFVYTPIIDFLLQTEAKSLLKFNLNVQPSKLYLIVAPSGFGKTSLIEELKYCGVKQTPKITTRPYRPLINPRNKVLYEPLIEEFNEELKEEFGKNYEEKVLTELSKEFTNTKDPESESIIQEIFEILSDKQSRNNYKEKGIKSIKPSKFTKQVKDGKILGSHLYKGNLYGFEKKKFDKLVDSTDQYVFDICDLDTALKVREENEGRVEIIGIFPSLLFAGFGLEKKIENYKLINKYSSYIMRETKNRLNQIIADSRFIEENHDKFDLILDKDTIRENRNTMLEYMSRN